MEHKAGKADACTASRRFATPIVGHGHSKDHRHDAGNEKLAKANFYYITRRLINRKQLQRLFYAFVLSLTVLGTVLIVVPQGLGALSPSESDPSLPYILAGNGPRATDLAIGIISGPNPVQRRRVRLMQETWFTSLDSHRDGVLVFSNGTDADVPAVGIEGTGHTWRGAQNRWLPALSYLLMAFPSAKWYMLVDDDTFLIPKNLKEMLRRRIGGEPDRTENEREGEEANATESKSEVQSGEGKQKRVYLGHTLFVKPHSGELQGRVLPFAHGGSGVVLSATLLRDLVPLLTEISAGKRERCQNTGYWDGDLSLCLTLLLGVKVLHETCLHSSGPMVYQEKLNSPDGQSGQRMGWLGDKGKPCSFHYAFRPDVPREKSAKGGREENDAADDSQVKEWHQKYNLGAADV